MIIEVYESKIENSTTVICDESQKYLLESDSVLIRTIEGEDWDDCMRQHYELMGWEPYIPF
jgi:hypothetical protein